MIHELQMAVTYLSLFCSIMDWGPTKIVPVVNRPSMVQNPFQTLYLYDMYEISTYMIGPFPNACQLSILLLEGKCVVN